MKTSRHTCEAGVALIAVLLILSLLMALAVGFTTTINMDSGLRGAFTRTTTGFYAAESGLNRGMGDFRNIFLAFHVPTATDFLPHSFTLGARTVTYSLCGMDLTHCDNPPPEQIIIPTGQVFGGLSASQYIYIVNSQSRATSETEANVGAEFDVGYIPLFQFVAFYSNDLEILPGPDMHLHGRVHSNGTLYLNSENSLFIEDNQGAAVPVSQRIYTVQVTAKGDVYRGRKDRNECHGTVTVDKLQDTSPPTPDLDPQVMPCIGGTRKVPIAELATWKGSIVSQIQSIEVPKPDIIAKGSGAFWTNADLRIVLDLNTPGQLNPPPNPAPNGPVLPYSIVAQDAAGNVDAVQTARLIQFMTDAAYNLNFSSMLPRRTLPIFYTAVPTCGSPANPANATAACYNNPPFANFASDARVYASNNFDLDYRRGGFYNWREKKWMILLDINLADLLDWNLRQAAGNRFFDPADTTDGGLVIYASVQGPNSAVINNYGVRVFGSRNLRFPVVAAGGDPTGVTFVSDQAMYVTGDYNRGNIALGDLPKQPAAVIGDSINVLSNNYFNAANACTNDCQSNLPEDNAARNALSTTLNTAFLGGVDTTVPGTYNGGLENYPRFHEDWGGTTLTYLGSFVSLGTPGHVNGPWCGTGTTCNIYTPPLRNWDYDPGFNDVKNLPPLTPRFVYVQQVLFTENFK